MRTAVMKQPLFAFVIVRMRFQPSAQVKFKNAAHRFWIQSESRQFLTIEKIGSRLNRASNRTLSDQLAA